METSNSSFTHLVYDDDLCLGGWKCEWFTAGQRRGGGQRGLFLRRVSRHLLQSVQLPALWSHILWALSPHTCQKPTNKHSLPSVSHPHLTHRLPQRWSYVITWTETKCILPVCMYKVMICFHLFLFRAQPDSKDLLPKSVFNSQAELSERLMCKMASAQLS